MSQYSQFTRCSADNLSGLSPPIRGLTFAAQWDADTGTVTLSSAKSLAPSKTYCLGYNTFDSDNLPSDIDDQQSQSLTVDSPVSHPSRNTEAFAAFGRTSNPYLEEEAIDGVFGSPLASSTEHGRDVYVRKSRFSKTRRYSCFDILDEELNFDAKLAFVDLERLIMDGKFIEDEGFFEGRGDRQDPDGSVVFVEPVLNSSFSTTTTSTSNYVEVRGDVNRNEHHPPLRLGREGLDSFSGQDTFRRQRLVKRRPVDIPTKPSQVLAREVYNYVTEPLQSVQPVGNNNVPNFIRGLNRWKRQLGNDDRWVKVDVMPVVTQSYVEI